MWENRSVGNGKAPGAGLDNQQTADLPLEREGRSKRGVGHEWELPADTRRGSASAAGKELQVYKYFRAMLYTRQAMELSKASKTLL